jgi:hypothetical protein
MADELVSMGDQFKGLPMGDLIGGPLMAACDAQVKMANATANFIKVVGFLPPADPKTNPNDVGPTRTAIFKFKRPQQNAVVTLDANGNPIPSATQEEVEIEVPLLAVVKIPSLSITTVDVEFQMEVKSSFSETTADAKSGSLDATIKAGWGPISASVKIQGSVSSSKNTERKSDNSAKYSVKVHAEDSGMPEGLARVLDMMNAAVAPKSISAVPGPKAVSTST